MKRSTDRILTSHVGSLPRPADLAALNKLKQSGEPYEEETRVRAVRSAVADIVRKQAQVGIDVVNDGEFGKLNFLNYQDRLSGFDMLTAEEAGTQGHHERREQRLFSDFYRDVVAMPWGGARKQPYCTGPIRYAGHELVRRDIENLKAALQGVAVQEAFMTALAPGSFARGHNRFYKTDEEFVFALGAALGEEYKAIVDAGFVLQIDDPGLPDSWDMFDPEPSVEEYLPSANTAARPQPTSAPSPGPIVG